MGGSREVSKVTGAMIQVRNLKTWTGGIVVEVGETDSGYTLKAKQTD